MDSQHEEAGRYGSGPIVFIGVIALVLVAVAGWLLLRPDNEPEILVDAGDGELQQASEASLADPPADADPIYLVLDPVPADYRALITDAGTSGDSAPDGTPTVDIWGRIGSEDLFADGDLVVARLSDQAMELDAFGSDPTLEIAGRAVQPLDDDDGIHGVAWLEDDQKTVIVLLSVSFDQETILEMATGLLTTGELDPQGLDLLARDALFFPPTGPRFGGANSVTYVHRDQLDDSSGPAERPPVVYYVVTLDSSDGSEAVAAWFELSSDEQPFNPTSEPVIVGDFTGELVSYADGPDDEFAWLELRFPFSDEIDAAISSQGITVEELVALAATARLATPEEVQIMKRDFEEVWARETESVSTTTAPAPPTPQTSGDVPDTPGRSTTTITVPATIVTTGPADTPPTTPLPETTTTTELE